MTPAQPCRTLKALALLLATCAGAAACTTTPAPEPAPATRAEHFDELAAAEWARSAVYLAMADALVEGLDPSDVSAHAVRVRAEATRLVGQADLAATRARTFERLAASRGLAENLHAADTRTAPRPQP